MEAGSYDLVIHPSNLWLTIHESIGHATELDRALGYEANYAGTSFATIDKLGTLQYGSPVMNVTGDRTASTGWPPSGTTTRASQTQSWDIVKDGVLVGYQLDRSMAQMMPELNDGRSNGCAYADSPGHIPIQRMANVSLQAAPDGPSTEELISRVEHGIFVVGDKSWSIDMQRYNFQFTGQRFYRIEDGRLAGQLRDVAYQATTTDFWGSMEAVGGPRDLGAARRDQLRQGPARPGRRGLARLPDVAVPRRQRPEHHRRGRHAVRHAMTPRPQELVEHALAAAAVRPLRRDRPRLHQRQPALGEQHPDHQRRHAHGHRDGGRFHGTGQGTAAGSVSARASSTEQVTGSSRPPTPPRERAATPRTPPSCPRARRPTTGSSRPPRPPSTCTATSRPPWVTRSAAPTAEQRILYGFVDHDVTTTYLGTSTGVRARHVQPTGHYGCTAKPTDLSTSAWVGGATRDFSDVDAHAMDAELARRLGWASRRVDLPAGRYDTVLPPTAVADLMIYAYWTAAARDAHDGQTVFSKRGGGTRIGERLSRPAGADVLRPGLPGSGGRAVRQRLLEQRHRERLRQRPAPEPDRLDQGRHADGAAAEPVLRRAHRPAGDAVRRQPGGRGRRRARAAPRTWWPASSAACW